MEDCSDLQQAFRTHGAFPPNPDIRSGRKPLPPFLRAYPQAKTMIEQYCSHHLQHLSLWAIESQLNGKVDPCNLSVEAFKKSLRLTKVSLQTTLRWIHKLGMQYDSNKKTCYVVHCCVLVILLCIIGHARQKVIMERSQKHKNTNCARHQLLMWHLPRHDDTTNLCPPARLQHANDDYLLSAAFCPNSGSRKAPKKDKENDKDNESNRDSTSS